MNPAPQAGAAPRPARPLVMGIVNVTPDSFSDGGRHGDAAVAHARRLLAEGADLLDVGGESTRPGADPVGEGEEIDRIVPVIAALASLTRRPISVDTMKPATARAAMAAGASIWNDVTALTWSPDSLATAAELGCGVVLMHMRGRPQTMQRAPRYDDVVAEVASYLRGRAEAAMAAGVARPAIWLDPGIGFGKTQRHNLDLIAHLDRLAALGFPVLVGASRKGFIAGVADDGSAQTERLGGSLAVALAAASAGAAVVRAHDVAATVQALTLAAAIRQARSDG